jgi:hypothetical protein
MLHHRLSNYGLSSGCLSWFLSYITKRQSRVRAVTRTSGFVHAQSGVLQSSCTSSQPYFRVRVRAVSRTSGFVYAQSGVLQGSCTRSQAYFRVRVWASRRTSGFVHAQSGVLQGSGLGPLLFNAFINDLCEVISDSSCLLFTDDLEAYRAISSSSNRLLLQTDIDCVHKWCSANFLKPNVSRGRSR